AREQRYRLLAEARRSLRLRYVATGHQREDQEETLFMRFLQGGVLTGIAPVRGSRIRPLLEVERADIDLYLRSLGVDAVRDSSNSNEQFLRNRIRRRTLPQLRAEYPGLRRAMEQLRERETLTEDFLDQAARRRIAWRRVGGGVCTSTDAFFAAPAAVRLRALYQGLAAMPKRTRESVPSRLPYRFLRPIAVAAGPDGAHLQDGLLLSGHGLELRVRAGCLFWGLHIVQPGKRGYLLSVPEDGTAVWHVERSRIAAEWGSREQRADSARRRSANSYVVAGQELHPPLVLRGRLPGDELPADAGTKSVKRLLAGFKVPVPLRDLVPVLEDSQGIVALIAAPFGGKNIGRSVVDRSKAGDRVLRLTISRNEE
ncbi:tRNA lysidine(34) synthetase TilS, partial [Salinispira pacifica]